MVRVDAIIILPSGLSATSATPAVGPIIRSQRRTSGPDGELVLTSQASRPRKLADRVPGTLTRPIRRPSAETAGLVGPGGSDFSRSVHVVTLLVATLMTWIWETKTVPRVGLQGAVTLATTGPLALAANCCAASGIREPGNSGTARGRRSARWPVLVRRNG